MIFKKEFYFVRHGQTDHNVLTETKRDHPAHIALNSTGVSQAKKIEPLIASLPIRAICCSPFKRAQETRDIIAARLSVPSLEIEDLRECSVSIWEEMRALGDSAYLKATDPVLKFMHCTLRGVNRALEQEGPVLIVSHGGVHWALCCSLGVDCEWTIDNCAPTHFTIDKVGKWKAKRLV